MKKICKFKKCKVDKLAKSHIYPRKLIKRITDDYKIIILGENSRKPGQSLPVVNDILCTACDNGPFSILDNIGYKFFDALDLEIKRITNFHYSIFGEITLADNLKPFDSQSILATIRMDSQQVRTFFLSVLLRQSYSSIGAFKDISIGNVYEEAIATEIQTNERQNHIFVTIFITLPSKDDLCVKTLNQAVTSCSKYKGNHKHHFWFRISNLACIISLGRIRDNEMAHMIHVDKQIWNGNTIAVPVIPVNKNDHTNLIRPELNFLNEKLRQIRNL